ncbi:hypothetical protein ABI59_12685 [Acidobacteria bacterium Mor1]|nr:hypothetical protein ABI59_12685 [Acidobacteria bacterium Mor1]
MFRSTRILLLALVTMALLLSTGCVSKKLFRKNVEDNDARVGGVESAVEQNERRIADLSDETDSRLASMDGRVEKAQEASNSALSRADLAAANADRAMKGKLLWAVTLSDDRVRFGFDKAELSPEAKADLDGLAEMVKALDKAVYLEVEGHTDNIGSEDYNVELGEKRALVVMRYLNAEGGIPLHAMNSISYGSSQPVTDNGSPDGRAQNRRVVIRVLE